MQFIAITAAFGTQRHESAGECATGTQSHQATTTGQTMTGLDSLIFDNTDGFLQGG